MKNKIYAVQLSTGTWDDAWSWILFVSNDKEVVENYIIKYNSLLKKLKEFYESKIDEQLSFEDEDENSLIFYCKHSNIKDTHEAVLTEIKIR